MSASVHELSASASSKRSVWLILEIIPNVIVMFSLAGIFWYGHHNNWRMPTLAALANATNEEVKEPEWCDEHLVPELECIECQPGLVPDLKDYGFCWEHGVAQCVVHHPELAQTKSAPPMPSYDTVKAIEVMARPVNNSRDTLALKRVQFASAEAVAKAGVEVDVVQERPLADSISANGELMFNPARVAHLSTRVPGTVTAVYFSVGEEVKAGDILALIDAAQVGQAKTQLLQAVVQLKLRRTHVDRLSGGAESGAIASKALIEAEASLQEEEIRFVSARQALDNLGFEVPDDLDQLEPEQIAASLRFLGIQDSLAETLPAGSKTANLFPLRAAYDGVIMDSELVAGEYVDNSKLLFTVCDPKQMWLMLNVRQEDAKYVKKGLPVKFSPDDGTGLVQGQVAWLSPAVDEKTRTLRVQVTLDNTNGTLRDRTFGTGKIGLRDEPRAVVVPRQALQATPDARYVFIRDKNYFDPDAPKLFHVRQVRIGAQDSDFVEVLGGVLPGEVVATKGSAVLLAQLLRSNLGAGCGCHDTK
jgi:membrane fusion protein, heavy metal efflux system